MVTLEQTRKYDKMNLEQLEDLYTATIKSIRKTDDIQSQINLNSKLNYLYSMIMEKKNAWYFIETYWQVLEYPLWSDHKDEKGIDYG